MLYCSLNCMPLATSFRLPPLRSGLPCPRMSVIPGHLKNTFLFSNLTVISVSCSSRDCLGHYNKLLIDLHVCMWCQTCDHIITLDLDTLVHITKNPARKHCCYVYRLDRRLPHEDSFRPLPSPSRSRFCRQRRRVSNDLNLATSCKVSQWHPSVTVYQYTRWLLPAKLSH